MTNASMNACCSANGPVASGTSARTSAQPGALPRLTLALGHALKWLKRAQQVHKQRRALAKLTDAQITDIGLSRATVDREAARAFWDFTLD